MYRHHCLLLVFLIASVVPPVCGADRGPDGSAGTDNPGASAKVTITGKLARNVSTQPNKAPYVLLDRRGNIQSLVSPGEDANLEPFIGRKCVLRAIPTCLRTREYLT